MGSTHLGVAESQLHIFEDMRENVQILVEFVGPDREFMLRFRIHVLPLLPAVGEVLAFQQILLSEGVGGVHVGVGVVGLVVAGGVVDVVGRGVAGGGHQVLLDVDVALDEFWFVVDARGGIVRCGCAVAAGGRPVGRLGGEALVFVGVAVLLAVHALNRQLVIVHRWYNGIIVACIRY